MGKKKKVKAPTYQEMQDTEYIAGLREDLPGYRDMTNEYLQKLDVLSPEVQKTFQGLANDYTGAQWSDLSRQYLKDYNTLNQANYNRFGNLGSTGALYNTDSLQSNYNDLATNIAAQTASQYQNLVNNYYNQKLNTLNAANSLYQTAGTNTYTHDQNNWNIRNKNIEAKYVADVQNAQNSGNWLGGMLSGATSGAGMGASIGGPWGALIGGVAGGALGALGSNYGGGSNQSAVGNAIGYLGGLGANKLNLNNKANKVAAPTNSRNFMGGAYRW